MTNRTQSVSLTTFEVLAAQHQDQDLVFEISGNHVFCLPIHEPSKKMGPILIENENLLKRILFYSKFVLTNKRAVSFNTIIWKNSNSEIARFQNYEFSNQQESLQLKLSKIQETHPRNLALLQNAEILSYIDDVILITEAEPIDLDGPRIIYVNQAFEKMSGFAFSDVFGKTPRLFQGEKTSDTDRKKIREALYKWEPVTVEILNYTKSKQEFDVELSINPRKDEVGWYTHWVAIQRDITLRKETQRQLEHQSKLALIGEIAAGVGHEINNPIAIIKGLLEITVSSLKAAGFDDEKVFLNFERMDRASDRITHIAKGLRAYSRVDNAKSAYFCVYDLLKETVDMLCDVYKEDNVFLRFSAPIKKLTVFGNRGRLQQAVINLIANAKDATEGGSSRLIFIGADSSLGNISISISDNGRGIPESIKEKIFNPFFTTKDVNKGTGIGLSMVNTIIKEHNGSISFKSEVGLGTEFDISLPAALAIDEELEEAKKVEIKLVKNEDKFQLLVVEDEEDLREIMHFHFSKMGLSVHLAENGKIALEMIKARHFDLIISDISMPVMDGVTLFKLMDEFSILHPPKFLFITGGAGRESEKLRDIIDKVDDVLEKPFTPDTLFNKLCELFPDKFGKK
jgi:PAS domain S-box-containing protein